MQVVDPHIHLWNLETGNYPWLARPTDTFMGDYRSLARTYQVKEFLADAQGVEVIKVVHIDAGHDPAGALNETAWLQSLADAPGNRGMPQGLVPYADLSAPDTGALLAAHAAHPNVRGIRQILNVHPDPLYDYVGRHFMREPAWREGFKLLRRHGLSFDLQIYPHQMAEAAELARENPETPLILNHTGMFVDRATVAGWRAWRDGMRLLAGCPNIAAKISGLGMMDHSWSVESIRPYVLETIDAFGVGRCMFASNFPVDR
ncbi:MAG: amidohydrolase family protein, partial [Acetobacteraceae bacterium]|nr:amidohydrolase family protein [Acetobacteraceae bacterium]